MGELIIEYGIKCKKVRCHVFIGGCKTLEQYSFSKNKKKLCKPYVWVWVDCLCGLRCTDIICGDFFNLWNYKYKKFIILWKITWIHL